MAMRHQKQQLRQRDFLSGKQMTLQGTRLASKAISKNFPDMIKTLKNN